MTTGCYCEAEQVASTSGQHLLGLCVDYDHTVLATVTKRSQMDWRSLHSAATLQLSIRIDPSEVQHPSVALHKELSVHI